MGLYNGVLNIPLSFKRIWKKSYLFEIKCYQQLYLSKSSIFPPFLHFYICLKKSKQIKFQIQRKQFYISICNSKHWPCSWGYYVYFSLKFEQNNEQLDEMRAKLAAKIVNCFIKTWMFDIDSGFTFIFLNNSFYSNIYLELSTIKGK